MFGIKDKQDGKFTKHELKEIDRISDRLESDEKVLVVAKQKTRRPGGSATGFGANTFFVTSERIIIYNPSLFKAREDIQTFSFESIVDVRLEKGVFSSTIYLIIPGLTEIGKASKKSGVLSGIPKDKGERFVSLIKEKINEIKRPSAAAASGVPDDSLKILRNRYANGEITKEEFEEMKKDLQ